MENIIYVIIYYLNINNIVNINLYQIELKLIMKYTLKGNILIECYYCNCNISIECGNYQ